MAAQQTQGIQTLLEAEKEAAKIVQQARQYRVQRLKDARSEAEREIEEYKRMKEEEFQAFEASHVGTTSTTQAALNKETEASLKEIDDIYQQKKDAVISAIGKRAIVVQPEAHRNLKKQNA